MLLTEMLEPVIFLAKRRGKTPPVFLTISLTLFGDREARSIHWSVASVNWLDVLGQHAPRLLAVSRRPLCLHPYSPDFPPL
jgi:hypothetical protein